MSEASVIQRAPASPVTIPSLLADFTALGIVPGMTLLLHSSLSALGWVCGGPVAVILALEELLARCPRFTVDAEAGRLAGGHFVRPYESRPFTDRGS